jgi:hypothetical protein
MWFIKKMAFMFILASFLFSCKKDTTGFSNEFFLSGNVKESGSGNSISGVDIHFTFLKIIHYDRPLSKTIQPQNSILDSGIKLYQNYPNPFNPTTQISFSLPTPTALRLEIFAWPNYKFIKTLKDDTLNTGTYVIRWDGTNEDSLFVTNGIYAFRLTTPDTVIEKKMVLHMESPEYIKSKSCIPIVSTNSEGKFSINSCELPPIGFSVLMTDAYGNETGAAVVSDTFNIILLKDGYSNQIQPFKMNMNKNIHLDLKMLKN